MKLFRCNTNLVKVRLPSPTDCGGIIVAVPQRAAEGIRELENQLENADAANADLERENERLIADNARLTSAADALDQAAEELKQRYADERRAADQVMAGLRKALADKQAELDNALAQFKKLDADYVEACGRLQDAEAHISMCERADAIAEEAAWKRLADR